jgi:hypothetical protein
MAGGNGGAGIAAAAFSVMLMAGYDVMAYKTNERDFGK